MIQKTTEVLRFDDGTRTYRFHPAVKNGCIVEGARHYSLELFRKPARFGEVPVDQFWMRLDSIYGASGKQPRNYEVIVEHYKAQCMQALTILDDEVLDSYILAKLLPYVRRNGSRRIFDDAVLTSSQRFGESKQDLIQELNDTLAAGQGKSLDLETFHRHTAKFLGPPELTPAQEAAYQTLADELLGEGRRAVGRWGVDGLQVPIAKMQRWMTTFARRSGNEDQKFALDIISYECRAAMHRCYSAVWDHLLTHLEAKYKLDQASVQYHRLMHFDPTLLSNRPDAYFHLFHGHVFGLHPALGLFLQTPTGGRLVGDYLRLDDADRPFHRLLHGFWVAISDYHVRSELCAEKRKKIGRQVENNDLAGTEAAQTGGKGRRCLFGPGHDDSNHAADRAETRRRAKRRRAR